MKAMNDRVLTADSLFLLHSHIFCFSHSFERDVLLIKCVGKRTDRSNLFTILVDVYKLNYSSMGGYAVAQLVEGLRYKSEGCGFDSRWCHWTFPFI